MGELVAIGKRTLRTLRSRQGGKKEFSVLKGTYVTRTLSQGSGSLWMSRQNEHESLTGGWLQGSITFCRWQPMLPVPNIYRHMKEDRGFPTGLYMFIYCLLFTHHPLCCCCSLGLVTASVKYCGDHGTKNYL